MGHQLPDRNRLRVPERVMHPGQLRHVTDDRIVQFQQAPIAQLHDRDPGHRLGDRRPVIDGSGVHRDMGIGVLLAQMIGDYGAAAAHHVEAAADDARPPHFLAMKFPEVSNGCFEGTVRSQGRAGD
jgi:hypothetical protein